jgi:hypothetical protein
MKITFKSFEGAGDISGKPGSSLWLRHVPGVACEPVPLLGPGDKTVLSEAVFANIIRTALLEGQA